MGGKGGGGGGASSNVTVTSTAHDTVDVLGLDDVKTDLTLHLPQPLKTEASNTVELKPVQATVNDNTHLTIDPLKSDSSVSVDVKPAVVDLCLTMNVGKLPNVCVRQPYQHHIGLTLYGSEIWGVTFTGEQQTVLEELDRQPKVAWGGSTTAWPPPRSAGPADRSAGERPPPTSPASRDAGGLRIRLGP